MAVAPGFETDGVDTAVDFRNAQDLFNLLGRPAFGQINGFAAETACPGQAVGVDHDRAVAAGLVGPAHQEHGLDHRGDVAGDHRLDHGPDGIGLDREGELAGLAGVGGRQQAALDLQRTKQSALAGRGVADMAGEDVQPVVADQTPGLRHPRHVGQRLVVGGDQQDVGLRRGRRLCGRPGGRSGQGRDRDLAGLLTFGRRARLELPPAAVPQFNLSEQEVDDIAEFLKWSSKINTNGWPPNKEG